MTNWQPLPGDAGLTPEEFASAFKVSVASAKRAAKSGQLPAIQIGKQWRILTAATRVVPGLEPAEETEEAI